MAGESGSNKRIRNSIPRFSCGSPPLEKMHLIKTDLTRDQNMRQLLYRSSLRLSKALLIMVVLFTPAVLRAIAGTSQVAWEGKPVEELDEWPDGVSELVNDPVRVDGWNPWFSEFPNDVYHYELQIRSMEDVDRLLAKLAAIKANKVQVQLDSRSEADHIGWTTKVDSKKNIGATFSIGNQEVLDQWYERQEKAKNASSIGAELNEQVRVFGVNRLTNGPSALPPTLTLYVGHKAIDLKKLSQFCYLFVLH